jgi:hypothetical protein
MTLQKISRRTALTASSAALLGGALGAAGADAAHAAAATSVRVPVALSDEALLDAYVRLRASTDGRTSFGWLDALRYAVIDGEIHPLCRVLAAGIARFDKVSSGRYAAVMLEVAHYVDIGSGELLDTLAMPQTGVVVKVPHYRTGPKRVAFGVSIDESEVAGEGIPRKQLESFAPVGDVRLQRSVSEPWRENDALFVRHEEYGRVTPRDPAAARIFYREWTSWRGPAERALDARLASAPSEMSYSAITSWRPWMQMGKLPGHTVENGRGCKIATLAQLPEQILRLTERLHPDVLDYPDRVLDLPPR